MVSWVPILEAPRRLPTSNAPNLKQLELDGYPFMLPLVQPLLNTLSVLEVFRIFCGRESSSTLVWEHGNIHDLFVGNSGEKTQLNIDSKIWRNLHVAKFGLTHVMPSLQRVDVEKSSVKF